MRFVTEIYQATKTFPRDELYGLTNQLRRAAVSVPSNIAEGQARFSAKEFHHFLSLSRGSLVEIETQLLIAQNLDYLPPRSKAKVACRSSGARENPQWPNSIDQQADRACTPAQMT
jgi:four helix bundle protein